MWWAESALVFSGHPRPLVCRIFALKPLGANADGDPAADGMFSWTQLVAATRARM